MTMTVERFYHRSFKTKILKTENKHSKTRNAKKKMNCIGSDYKKIQKLKQNSHPWNDITIH